jgi:hypothetical protein
MQYHAESTRIGTVIKSEVETTSPLESGSVMAPNGA